MNFSFRSLVRQTFRAGITLKGIDGALETMGAALLWFVKPSELSETLRALCQHELSRDPDDWIAGHLLHATVKMAAANPGFASFFLLSHGLTKVALVLCLWMNKLWAYPLTIAVFGAFSIYQMYRYTHTHSPWLLALTILDVVLIYLTWEEYGQQKKAARREEGS